MVSDLSLEKIKNMIMAHEDGVYALEARENLYEIILYLVTEVEINNNSLCNRETALENCYAALAEERTKL